MPRARTTTTEELISDAPKKRAPRKRPTLAEGEVAAPRPRAPRRKVVPEEQPEVETPRVAEVSGGRRAPTPLRAERTASSKNRRSLMVALGIFCLLSGVGVAIGLSDSGQIDVVAVVNERNERVNRGEVREGESSITVPVQSGDVRANGGLVPADPSSIPPPPTPEAATTTDATASSTDDGTATSSEAAADESVPDTETATEPEAST
jgi:hypothetical protein